MLLRITVRTGFTCFSRHGTWGKKKEFNPLGKSFLSLIMHYIHKITNLREKNSQKGSPNVNMKNKTGMGRNIFFTVCCYLLASCYVFRLVNIRCMYILGETNLFPLTHPFRDLWIFQSQTCILVLSTDICMSMLEGTRLLAESSYCQPLIKNKNKKNRLPKT